MKRIVVIGIGNILMKDDSIGVRVVESIKSSLITYGITGVVGETDSQYCLKYISPADFLVVIDGMDIGKEPGSIKQVPLSEVLKSSSFQFSQHGLSLLSYLLLYYPNIQGCFIGIQIAQIEFSDKLSEVLNECYAEICTNVFEMVRNIKGEIGRSK